MSEIILELRKNGSMKLPGPLVLIDENGQEQVIDKPNVAFCRCGASKEKPFCDGSHKEIGFQGPSFTVKLKAA
ncbi:MAG: CDGSH iron-sulfur domain-containing protein [Anaerolineales bacterium]|nr:CDGSH iron-sulfur domain-containing protein [Anaerolineales bacterium]MDW8448243.1 CDGSH iron-sulfur domain-containing protein [Anaerolineales bacterium]